MHSIRSKARHAAWRVDDGETNWNPFARRIRTRSSGADDIEALQSQRHVPQNPPRRPSAHSEECITTEGEIERANDVPQPKHAKTFGDESSDTSPIAEVHEKNKDFSDGSNGAATEQTVVGQEGSEHGSKPRKRKFGFLPRKHDKEDGEKLEPVDTEDSKKSKPKITVLSQLRVIFLSSWINILLVAVPAGFACNYAHLNGWAIFIVNFIAIIPLAAMLSYATEELALRVGETLGGLLNATFGNAVELIVSILALVKKEIVVVQTSLIGSMLSNLLLVLGMCFLFGGFNRSEQFFNVTVAQTASSLLALAIGSLIIPTAFHQFSGAGNEGVTEISRGTSILLLVVYGCYLFFQLKTHSSMYNEPSKKVEKRATSKKQEGDTFKAMAGVGKTSAAATGGGAGNEHLMQQPDEEKEEPQLSIIGALVVLGGSTVLVAFCAEFMVDSISLITCSGAISETFVGLILLPIVGNAAEHATSVTVAIKDKMDLAIGVAVGSSMQIALLVFPLVIVIGWIMGNPDMNLVVDGFQISLLFVAVILVNYLIQDGKSHWLEGVLLMTLYLIISVAAWFYPKASGIDCSAS